MPLGEEPVVAGPLRGEDGGGFGWSYGLKNGGEGDGGESEDRIGKVAAAQARDAQDEDEGEGVRGHQGMESRCEGKAEGGPEERAKRGVVVECEGHG
jgi:hypothetical protein